jgi:hypothetical protein
VRKIVWRGLPVPTRARELAEAHYVEVHVPLSRRFLLLDPAQVAYSTLRARRQLDIAGGFYDATKAWRFIVFLEDPSVPAREPTPAQRRLRRLLTDDNPLVIGESIRCEVEEEVLVDRLSGQTSFVKALLEFDRHPGRSPAESEAELRRFADELADRARASPGTRLLVANWARRQQRQRMRADGGYEVTDWEPAGPKVGYLELLFDNPAAAADLLGAEEVIDAVFGPAFADAGAYLVEERCEFDRR